jgi:tetratricopeptide (TPR) repeat protein
MEVMRHRALLWLLPLAACAHGGANGPPSRDDARALPLDGAVVRAEIDPLTGLAHYDASQLCHLAADAERQGRLDDAIALYDRFVKEFAHSTSSSAARFNLGLLYEKAQRWADAVAAYTPLADSEAPASADDEGRRTWLDAHFRLAVCLGKQGAWWDATGVFDEVLTFEWLTDFDRLEAMVGRGIAILHAGEPESADIAFGAALRFQQEAAARGPFADNGLAAEAAFHMGEIALEKYDKTRLEFPIDTLRERLEQKCGFLLSAQHRFLRAIRLGDTHTVAAAGFKIGWLYENLYDVIVGLETPADLDAEQAEVYKDEVRQRVGVLVKKAIMVYERTLAVGKSASTAQAWVSRIEQALARLRTIYLDQPPSLERT